MSIVWNLDPWPLFWRVEVNIYALCDWLQISDLTNNVGDMHSFIVFIWFFLSNLLPCFVSAITVRYFAVPTAFQVVSDTVPLAYYYIGLSRYRRRPILRVFVWQRTKLYVSKVSLWSWSFKFRASKEDYATVCVTFAGESRANKFHSKWQLWWVLDPLKQKKMISSLSIYLNRYMNV